MGLTRRGFFATLAALFGLKRFIPAPVAPPPSSLEIAAQCITDKQLFIIQQFTGQIYISDDLDVQDTPLYNTVTVAPGHAISLPNDSQGFIARTFESRNLFSIAEKSANV